MTLIAELKQLSRLVWPLLLAQITQTLMAVSDTVMAGRVSPVDMAAVAISAGVMLPVLFFLQGIILALPPLISRLNGAQQGHAIPRLGQQAMWLAALLAVFALAASNFTHAISAVITANAPLQITVAKYLFYSFLGVPCFLFYQVFRQYAEGLAVTAPSMLIAALGLAVNVAANYVFIYGKFGMPAMGGAGCGLATSLAFTGMMLLSGGYLQFAARMQARPLFHRWHRPTIVGIGEILKLGLPIGFTLLFETTLFAIVAILLARFGPHVVAAHQIAMNISSLMFMVPLSIGMACTIRIGFLLGQNKPNSAVFAAKVAIVTGVLLAAGNALLCYGFRVSLAQLYTPDEGVIAMAAQLLLVAVVFQFSDAVQIIAACALRGHKDTKVVFYLSGFSYWVVGLPSGYVLAMTDWIVPAMAAKGFWVGFIIGLSTAAITLSCRLYCVQGRITANPTGRV